MSLALYRKYRPATFGELKGQEHVADPLQQALRNGRINHAYLFSGPRGCGKTSSARILARSLNCEQGPTPEPCGTCDSCVALGPTGTGHIDVIEIDAASHGGVDDARDLRERAFFAPVSARFKVYIIDEAHMVTREGFNALLKLVEEPPPHLKFVFATTEPEKVIGTIRSRTHHYPFRLIPPGVLQQLVEEILQAENVPYEEAALPLAVRAGAGSARDTLSILDQLLAGSDEKGITYTRAVSLLGYTDSALLDEVVGAFAQRDGAAVFAAVDRVIESGQDPRRFAADLLERLRDLVILSNVPEAGGSGLLNVPPDELEQMRRQASSMGPGDLTRAADLLHNGLTEMRGATSPRLVLELVAARILLPAAYQDEAALLARLDRLERQGPTLPAPQVGTYEAPPVVRVPVSVDQGGAGQGSGGYGAAGEQPPPAQGGDPTSSVNRAPTSTEGERRSVDNPPAAAQGADGQAPQGGTPYGGTPQDGTPHGGGPASQGAGVAHGSSAYSAASPQQASQQASQQAAQQASQPAPRPAPQQPPQQAPAMPAAAGGGDVATVQRLWPDIIEAVKRKSRVAWMVIMSGVHPISLDRNLLTLAFDAEGKRTNFTNGGRDVVLREVLKERMGVDWRIDTVLGSGGAAPPQPRSGGGGGYGGRQNQPAPQQPPAQPQQTSGQQFGGQQTGAQHDSGQYGSGQPAPASPGYGGASGAPGDPSQSAGGFAGAPSEQRPPQAAAAPNRQPSAPSSPFEPSGAPSGAAPSPARQAPDPGPLPPPPDEPPPPPEPTGPYDERDEVDPDGDADFDGTEADSSGMALIQRELGGQIIREIDNI
ncbi:DNA polymerase III subunit gamma and tau [Actinomadura parmotrematis]|uniref:DNA-directed DNA polymerase n=1 Tax=Actinomadura parmotrematis TaxID=2864039 RepID=A0ABS7G371_9ACTN|nr:DNA polymerase III subunit gamma and tau [Actinomadura parmotrematis]MBW8486991.1 DNA polymerase III subunit gamma and tau [Actinomadura parmotrematis]